MTGSSDEGRENGIKGGKNDSQDVENGQDVSHIPLRPKGCVAVQMAAGSPRYWIQGKRGCREAESPVVGGNRSRPSV